MRLFVSVSLDGLESAIEDVQGMLADAEGIRCTDPAGTHVTLKFLGETDPDRLSELRTAIEAAVEDSGVGPFRAEFGGLGAFPHLDYISVVWVGVREGSEELTQLHEAIEARTVELGFEPEEHDFTPHTTIARMGHGGGKELVQNVLTERDPDIGRLAVDEIHLTESELTPEGPEYSTVDRFELD